MVTQCTGRSDNDITQEARLDELETSFSKRVFGHQRARLDAESIQRWYEHEADAVLDARVAEERLARARELLAWARGFLADERATDT